MLVSTLALVCAIGGAFSQDSNCDYTQNVQEGQSYYIYNREYPNNYTPGVQCRWIASCPTGYNCALDCTDIALPQTQGCTLDRLLVSRTGDPQLTSADYYCGTGTLQAVSTGQRISVGLITARTSPGGRFICRLYARAIQTTPPPATCSCGYKRQNRIVGGQPTGVNEYPMMAALADRRINQVKCGCVIISALYVLTAAHCFDGQNYNNFGVVVGEHDTTVADSPTQGFSIIRLLIHPSYSTSNYDYDAAILTLSGNIVFSDRVGPVCLPFKFQNTDLTNAVLTILGWGTTFIGGPSSNVLQKVDVQVVSQSSCTSVVPTLTPRQICTYTPGKDACQDDSGGPLLYTDPSTGLLFNMGIVSFGRFCAERGQPGVNTRVTSILNWIITNTPGANYCIK